MDSVDDSVNMSKNMDAQDLDQPIEQELSKETTSKSNLEKKKEPPTKKARTCTSEVWKSFTKIGLVDGTPKAKCNGCGKEYSCGGTKYDTSTLNRHISSCPQLSKYHNVGIMMLDHQGKLRARQLDQKKFRDLIAMAIIEHDLPYSFVEYKRVRELFKLLNPDVKPITRNTAVSDVWKFYLEQKAMLRQSLLKSPSRVCLTADCWTSITSEGYICVTAHFVDENWKLNSKILSFRKMEPPHTGNELANKIHGCLTE